MLDYNSFIDIWYTVNRTYVFAFVIFFQVIDNTWLATIFLAQNRKIKCHKSLDKCLDLERWEISHVTKFKELPKEFNLVLYNMKFDERIFIRLWICNIRISATPSEKFFFDFKWSAILFIPKISKLKKYIMQKCIFYVVIQAFGNFWTNELLKTYM